MQQFPSNQNHRSQDIFIASFFTCAQVETICLSHLLILYLINTHELWEGMTQPHHPMYSNAPAGNPIGPSHSPRICKLMYKSLANMCDL